MKQINLLDEYICAICILFSSRSALTPRLLNFYSETDIFDGDVNMYSNTP